MTSLNDFHTILVGCGKMGSALAGGAVRMRMLKPEALSCVDVSAQRAAELAATLSAATEVPPGGKRLFVMAVKPGQMEAALAEYSFNADDVVLSVAAGVTAADLREWAGAKPKVVRCMPNTPSLVGAGVTGVYFTDGPVAAVLELLSAVGAVVELPKEKDFDALTAISGSGPAYIFVAIEALADGGVLMGLDRATAIQLATQTVIGAGKLVEESDFHTAELKDQVASPGGITIAALASLEKTGFRNSLVEAVRVAATKSREMGEKLS